MQRLRCKVARLTREMVEAKPRGYWNRAAIEKWLADQGFIVGDEIRFPIAKTFNHVTRSAHFVQAERDLP